MSVFHHGVVLVPMPQTGPPTTGTWDAGTLIIDAVGDIYKCDVGGSPGDWVSLITSVPPPDLVASFPEFIDTFVNGVQAGMGWTLALNGGGATLGQIAPPAGKGGRNGVVGVIGASTGTSTTGRAGAILGSNLLYFQGGNIYTLWCRFLAEQLASATEDYRLRVGFLDDATTTEPRDGAYFEYYRAQSLNWQYKTVSNNARSVANSSVAVQDSNWIDLKIEVNASAQTAKFFIDDIIVGQHTTNIPTSAGRETSIGFVIHKTAGGTTRRVAFDRVYLKLEAA